MNPQFPDEVVVEILARVPIKAVYRSKSVCKLWYRLCSDKYFIRLYNKVCAKNPVLLVEVSESPALKSSLICVDKRAGVSEFSLSFLKDRVRVRASCNGLLCCSSIPEKGVYYVCNPMTREFKLLPRHRHHNAQANGTLVGLACNLSTLSFNVLLLGHATRREFSCSLFDSESNQWTNFVSFQDHRMSVNKSQLVFANRALHWLSSCGAIVALDLDCHAWRTMSLPERLTQSSGARLFLLDSDTCLSLIQISDAWMTLWLLTDYEKQLWDLVDTVSLRCITGLVPRLFPVCQTSDIVFLATHKQVLLYHRKTRLWKEMYSVKSASTLPLCFSAHAFRASILSCA